MREALGIQRPLDLLNHPRPEGEKDSSPELTTDERQQQDVALLRI